ncbi:hypothetical protein EDB19DRAFT_1914474 [Suillus lakei]|nr:hypothetical protein EDB19DRAFT_1914474 [Suillus lakei]
MLTCRHHEPEDAQTSHDADLFDDDDDDDESGAGNFMDALSQPPNQLPTDALPPTPLTQPPTDALRVRHTFRIDKRAREEVIRQEAQDSLDEQRRLIEEERERHIRDVNEKTRQWEAALKEREKQEIHAREEQAKKNAAEEMVEEREKVIAAEMEQRLQLEIEKLRAEKASELANMEQRFARHCNPKHPRNHSSKLPASSQSKKSGKHCGATRKMRLVSVAELSKSHREFQPEPDDAMSAMENSGLQRNRGGTQTASFINKGLPTSTKRSPRRKRMQDDEVKMERAAELNHERDFLLDEVQRLLKDIFSITQDADFIALTPRTLPSISHMDLAHLGMRRILDILVEQLQRRNAEEQWPMRRSDGYYKAILEDRYKRLRTTWRAVQPKVTAKGILETAAEVEERLITKRDESLKSVRQTTRRRNKYIHRAKILEHIINLKMDNEDEDLPAWMWLQKVIKTLGDGGMSSEESDVENDIHCVLRVKNMAWRHKIERELDVIDHQRVLDDDVFVPQARSLDYLKALYDGEWVDGLTGGQMERLNVSN